MKNENPPVNNESTPKLAEAWELDALGEGEMELVEPLVTERDELTVSQSLNDTMNITQTGKSMSDSQINELEDHDISVDDAYQKGFNVNSALYDAQGGMETLGRVVGVGLTKSGLTALENIGYMGDALDWFRLTDDFDTGYSNWLSEMAVDGKKGLSEMFPIYSKSDWDVGAIAQMAEGTIDSAGGFLLPGGIAGNLIGRAVKVANIITKLNAGKKAVNTVSALATGFVTNYAESMMMKQELHNNIVQEALARGLGQEEANRIASKESAEFLWQNKIFAVTDAVGLMKAVDPMSIVRGAAEKTKKSVFKGFFAEQGKQAVSEAFEEVGGDFLQKDNERDARKEMGAIESMDEGVLDFASRAIDFAATTEGVKSAVGGVFGGPVQAGAAKAVSKLSEKFYGKNGLGKPRDTSKEYDKVKPEISTYIGDEETLLNPGEAPMSMDKWLISKDDKYKDPAILSNALRDQRKGYDQYKEEHKEERIKYNNQQAKITEYNKELTEYEKGKKTFDEKREEDLKYNAKLAEFENTGKIAYTNSEVATFLERDSKLADEYIKAAEEGNEDKLKQIESEKFENLVLKHAKKGSLLGENDDDGSLESSLKRATIDNELSNESRAKAATLLEKVKGLSEQYVELNKIHENSPQLLDQAWAIRSSMNSHEDSIKELRQRESDGILEIISDAAKLTGKQLNTEQVELLQAGKDISLLIKLKKNKDLTEGARKEIDDKIEATKEKIQKLKDSGVKQIDGKVASKIRKLEKLNQDSSLRHQLEASYSLLADADKQINSPLSIKEAMANNKTLIESQLEDFNLDNANNIQRAINILPLNKKEKAQLQTQFNEVKEKTIKEEAEKEKEYDKAVAQRNNAKSMMDSLKVLRDKQLERKGIPITKMRKLPRKKKKAAKKKNPNYREDYVAKQEEQHALADQEIAKIDVSIESLQSEYDDANAIIAEDELAAQVIKDEVAEAYEKAKTSFEEKVDDGIKPNSDDVSKVKQTSTGKTKSTAGEVESGIKGQVPVNNAKDPEPKSTYEKQVSNKANDNNSAALAYASSISYQSGADEYVAKEGEQEVNFDEVTLAEWLETTPDISKKGMSLEVEVNNPEDVANYPTEDTLEDRHIRLYVLDENGKRITHGGRFVYGWVRKKAIDAQANGTEHAKLKGIRTAVDEAIKNGTVNKLRPKITSVGKGKLVETEGASHDLREKLSATDNQLKGSDIVLAIGVQGSYQYSKDDKSTFTIKDPKNPKKKLKASSGDNVNGFSFTEIKALDGSPFMLRLNSRKVSEAEATLLFDIYSAIAKGADPNKTKLNFEGASGDMTYQQALDLLIFEGSRSLDGDRTSYFEFKNSKTKTPAQLHTSIEGKETILATELDTNKEAIIEYFQTVWRTNNARLINKSFKKGGYKGKVNWFGKELDLDTLHYNDFMMDEKALTTNADFPLGRPFIKPKVSFNATSLWGGGKVEKPVLKKNVNTKQVKKASEKVVTVPSDAQSAAGQVIPTEFTLTGSLGGSLMANKKPTPEEKVTVVKVFGTANNTVETTKEDTKDTQPTSEVKTKIVNGKVYTPVYQLNSFVNLDMKNPKSFQIQNSISSGLDGKYEGSIEWLKEEGVITEKEAENLNKLSKEAHKLDFYAGDSIEAEFKAANAHATLTEKTVVRLANYIKADLILKGYQNNATEGIVQLQTPQTTQQSTGVKSENISSKGSEFAKKLTNPGNNLKVTYKGREFRNAEHAYQTYKSGEFDQKAYDSKSFKPVGSKPANKNTNYQTMVDILEAKLEQHPELIEGINQRGGVGYIEESTHDVTGDKFWESKGQNKFIEALADAYKSVKAPQESKSTAEADISGKAVEIEDVLDMSGNTKSGNGIINGGITSNDGC